VTSPWSNVYGTARSLVALGTLLTLLANSAAQLFRPAADGVVDSTRWVVRVTMFGLLHNHIELARWIAILVLAVVVSGWRPRVTGLVHWWVAWSFSTACVPADGGDQVAHVLALLMLPVALTDNRVWHWGQAPAITGRWQLVCSRIAVCSLSVIRLQGAVIYFNAAVGKFAVAEWANGTAMYYWLLDPRIGLGNARHAWVLWATAQPLVVAALSWLPILIELSLVLALAMSAENRLRKPLFVVAVAFHAGNILFFGLVSFFCAMTAVLILLLRPVTQPYDYSWATALWARVSKAVRQLRPSSRGRDELQGAS
jgi:antimicrobial peptide system SdpB family protein